MSRIISRLKSIYKFALNFYAFVVLFRFAIVAYGLKFKNKSIYRYDLLLTIVNSGETLDEYIYFCFISWTVFVLYIQHHNIQFKRNHSEFQQIFQRNLKLEKILVTSFYLTFIPTVSSNMTLYYQIGTVLKYSSLQIIITEIDGFFMILHNFRILEMALREEITVWAICRYFLQKLDQIKAVYKEIATKANVPRIAQILGNTIASHYELIQFIDYSNQIKVSPVTFAFIW